MTSNGPLSELRFALIQKILFLLVFGLFWIFANGSSVWANTCQTNGTLYPGPNYFSSSDICTIPDGSTVSSINVSGGGEISGDSLNIAVPYVSGSQPAAVYATDGSISLTGSTILRSLYGSGGGLVGLWANGSGAEIMADNININMGSGALAVEASNGGVITLGSGSTVNIGNGGGNFGLEATGTGSKITANGTLITGQVGGNDAMVYATSGGEIDLNDSTIDFASQGGGSEAVHVASGSKVVINGGSVNASGNGTYGFLSDGGGSNTIQLTDTSISSAGDVFHVNSANTSITADNTTATSDNGILLSVQGNSAVTFDAGGSTLYGAITTNTAGGDTSTTDITLHDGTVWTVSGSSNVTNLTNDNSTIIFTPPSSDPTLLSSYKTLLVAGAASSYSASGGTIELNTYLGTDNSPSDRLIISGTGSSATGSTNLIIHNTAGPGEETTGNGILVVETQSGATTQSGAFTLADEVRGGAIDYYLYRGGLNGTDSNEWFLRSFFEVGGGGNIQDFTPLPGQNGEFSIDPPSDPLPPGSYPSIGPELATDGVVQPMARQMGLTMLGTLHERIGDTLTADNAGINWENYENAAWGRFFGQQIDNRYQAFANPYTDGQMFGVQTGLDLFRGNFAPGHKDAAGLYIGYASSNVTVRGLATDLAINDYVMEQTGKVLINAYSFGGYWTHYGPDGWYLDAVIQGTYYKGNATTQFANLPISGEGLAPSLEAGYPIPLPLGPGFVLEPQVQGILQHISFHESNDGLGPVNLGSTLGETGRIGLRGQWSLLDVNDILWQPYGRVNLWKDWGGNPTTFFSGDEVPLVETTARLEFAGGLTAKLDDAFSFYTQAGYQFSVAATGDNRNRSVQGDAGLRYTW